jgi:hypothetical protein
MYRKVNTFVLIDILSASVGGMQLPEKYKEKFALLWKASGRTKDLRSIRRLSPCILQVVPSLPTKVLLFTVLGPPDSLVAPCTRSYMQTKPLPLLGIVDTVIESKH